MASATEALKEKAGLVKKKPGFFDMLEAMKPQIALALPRHLTPDRMIRIALTCCRLNPKLLECTPESLIAAIMISSQLGLEPGVLGQSFLVPFKRKDVYICQLIPGWMGILDLVSRSGKATAWTGAVYRGDQFDWTLGDQPYLKHRPCGDETTLTHVYAIARPVNSNWPIIEVWPAQKIWDHRNKINRVGEDHYSYTWAEQYARKVPLLQVLKYVPRSIELAAALSLDTAAETGGQELRIKDVPNIIEGTGLFSETPELPQAKTEKKVAVPEMCAECRMVDGHSLDCKYHPANQPTESRVASTGLNADTGGTATASAAPPATSPAETANPFKSESAKMLVRIQSVEKKKSQDKKDYYKVSALDEAGRSLTMICWHHRGQEILEHYKDAESRLAVLMAREKRDKKQLYYEIDDIVTIGAKDYKDGKPVPATAPAEEETW